MTDNGARALAERLHGANVDCDYSRKFDRKSCLLTDGPHSIMAAAILANGAAFKTAEELPDTDPTWAHTPQNAREALDVERLATKARRWHDSGMMTDSEYGAVCAVLYVGDVESITDADRERDVLPPYEERQREIRDMIEEADRQDDAPMGPDGLADALTEIADGWVRRALAAASPEPLPREALTLALVAEALFEARIGAPADALLLAEMLHPVLLRLFASPDRPTPP